MLNKVRETKPKVAQKTEKPRVEKKNDERKFTKEEKELLKAFREALNV